MKPTSTLRPLVSATNKDGKDRAQLRAEGPSPDAKRIALLAAEAGLDKKASEVEIIDVRGKVDYADYLVLMTGHSDRHVSAIAEGVDHSLGTKNFHSISVEGLQRGEWVLIDFVDVVVHVFQERTRSLYDLDGLWMDARRVELPSAPKPETA
ncbi:MAG TPA: ribosome silencing factor [Polyangiaceae bacterium]|nr:ribosome silencing factor [Polyangiaceae bacterium]